jgi:hypothetical protein
MSVATEEQRIRSLFERVETIEEVVGTLPEDDGRRARLLAVSRDALAEEESIRPVIAAKILGLSEKSVRAWVAADLRESIEQLRRGDVVVLHPLATSSARPSSPGLRSRSAR